VLRFLRARRLRGAPDETPAPVDEPPVGTGSTRPRRRVVRRSAVPRVSAIGARVSAALRATGWLEPVAAACVGFVAALCAGALLVLAAKLQNPDLGAGASPAAVFTAIVIVALASLGAPVRLGGLEVAALALGVVAFVGVALAWAVRSVLAAGGARAARGPRHGDPGTRLAAVRLRTGGVFAALSWIAALVFRLRAGATPVSAGAGEALVYGAVWGAAFATLGALSVAGRVRAALERPVMVLAARRIEVLRGVQAGVAMLAAALVGALAAVVAWLGALAARGLPPRLGLGDVAAAVVYVVAFLPNLVVSVVALSLGAPIEVGARITSAGRALGPLRELSLGDWAGGAAPWYLWLLTVIPTGACLAGGWAARRNSERACRAELVIAVAVATFAVPLAVVAGVADARLGAGLARPRGFAHVAPDTLAVALLAALWAAGFGTIGWRLTHAPSVASRASGTATSAGPGSGDERDRPRP